MRVHPVTQDFLCTGNTTTRRIQFDSRIRQNLIGKQTVDHHQGDEAIDKIVIKTLKTLADFLKGQPDITLMNAPKQQNLFTLAAIARGTQRIQRSRARKQLSDAMCYRHSKKQGGGVNTSRTERKFATTRRQRPTPP